MVVSIFASFPLSSSAASKKVSLKKSSITLRISKKKGRTVYGSANIIVKKIKGVSVKKITYKSSDKKIAKVSSKGKVKAKKAGRAKITATVTYKYKKRTRVKSLTFKVTVKDVRAKTAKPTYPTSPTEPTEEINAKALNKVPEQKENIENFSNKEFLEKLSKFSNKLYAMSAKDEANNYTMSPVSVYMAVSLLYSIGDEGVKSDIKELTGMVDSDFANTKELFRYLTKKHESFNQTFSQLRLTNSIWLNEGLETNPEVLNMLANDYYCNAYETTFSSNNHQANEDIRKFIKQQTNGLINQSFNIPSSTLFALINTLYFKDVWDLERDRLRTETRAFTTPSGTKQHEFILGEYVDGQVQETDLCYYFYTKTSMGYKAKFILPKSGHTLKECMTSEHLDKINRDTEFNVYDKDSKKHLTRCIFPSFKVDSSTKLKEIFADNNLLTNTFSLYYSPLVTQPLQVSDIKHKVIVDVSKTGIEGAAVTIIISKAGTAYEPDEKVYHDFVIDKNFGFIITDKSDVVLFEGQITDPS